MNSNMLVVEKQLTDLKKDIHYFQEDKIDRRFFSEFAIQTKEMNDSLCLKVDAMVDDLKTTGNYLQKFVPMQI